MSGEILSKQCVSDFDKGEYNAASANENLERLMTYECIFERK